jgi:hypothetical protein
MPPAYAVRARVVDLRTDTPRATDRMLLDSNVWSWVHYSDSGISATGARIPQGRGSKPGNESGTREGRKRLASVDRGYRHDP